MCSIIDALLLVGSKELKRKFFKMEKSYFTGQMRERIMFWFQLQKQLSEDYCGLRVLIQENLKQPV